MIQKCLASSLRITQGLGSRRRNLIFRFLGCQLEGYVWMKKIKMPRQWSSIRIGAGTALDEGVTLLASGREGQLQIDIGAKVYINQNTFIDASESISIGRQTMIGPNCYITDHDHQMVPDKGPGAGPLISRPTQLGERVWLGAGVIVLKGVIIGEGAVVGAGSVVTKDIPANSVAVGNPARVIRSGLT